MCRALLVLIAVLALLPGTPARADDRPLLIFAAASLTDALDAVLDAYAGTPGAQPVRVSYAASSTLARQIERGAPADLFISANPGWMDHLAEADLIRVESRRSLAGNRLVLVAPRADGASTAAPVAFSPAFDLVGRLGDGRLAMGDPKHVPAGIYGAQALAHFGLWQGLERRIARAANVRAALALVARGEAPLGLVYESDAVAEPAVTPLARFPADSHPPILYPVALTASGDAPDRTRRLLEFLTGEASAAIMADHGFTRPPTPPDA